jgi:F0F1-type ATP synthase gamma subunit
MLEKTFDMKLELDKDIKHIRLTFNKIKPGKSTISINKTDIIVVTTDRGLCRTSNIRKTSSRGLLTSLVDETNGS